MYKKKLKKSFLNVLVVVDAFGRRLNIKDA